MINVLYTECYYLFIFAIQADKSLKSEFLPRDTSTKYRVKIDLALSQGRDEDCNHFLA